MASAKDTQTTTPVDKRVAELDSFFARAELAQAPAWRPNSGEALSGAILGFRKGTTVEYGDYPILVIAGGKDGAPVSFHAFHTICRERLAELKPKKGDTISVLYFGERIKNGDEDKPEKDQTRYHLYYIEAGTVEETPVLEDLDFGSFLSDK